VALKQLNDSRKALWRAQPKWQRSAEARSA